MTTGTEDGVVSVGEVIAALVSGATLMPTVQCEVTSAAGRVLSEPITGPTDLPRFACAAMDGVAVRAADTTGATQRAPVRLSIVGERYAGAAPGADVTPGTVTYSATGAVIPEGADAIVRKERLTFEGDHVLVHEAVEVGTDIRAKGSDITAGTPILPAGTRLGPGHLTLLSALGVPHVPVRSLIRVAVIPTGDEVVAAGRAPGDGRVPDAVGPALAALLDEVGAHAAVWPPVRDDPSRLAAAIRSRAATADLVITIGGASVGDHDHLVEVLQELGEGRAWKMALRPGKPIVTGTVDGTPVIGLPGSPAAAHVVFSLVVRPYLAARGLAAEVPLVPAITDGPVSGHPTRRTLIRACVRLSEHGLVATPLPGHGGEVAAFGRTCGWIDLPPGAGEVATGTRVTIRPLSAHALPTA